jgi:hypothetical protein
MSFVIATPELVTAAATDLANIGSTLSAASAAAAAPTTGVLAAAEDEVSAAIASLFSGHAQAYQALGAQAAAFHDQFVQTLTAGAGSYVSAEAANAAAFTANPAQTIGQDLQSLAVFPPVKDLTGRPLFGTGGTGGLLGAPGNNGAAAFHQPFVQPLNAIAGSTGGVASRLGGLPNALGHIPPGLFMHTLFLPGTGIVNPFFGVPPGLVMHTEFLPGTRIVNPLFGVPPGHWDSQLIQALSMNNGAAAAAAQVAPWQQSLYNQSSKLAALLGLNPVTTPVASDPDLKSQVTNYGPLTQTSLSDPDDHYFDSISFSDPPLVTDTLTSGFEPTLGLGAPGRTINTFQSPVVPFLNSTIALPVTDPIARLFWALLPLGA